MNNEIIAVAFGAWWGGRGRRSSGRFSPGLAGTSASRPSWRSRCARAKAPTPKAERARKSRRPGRSGSVDIEELVGAEELLAEVGQRGQLGVVAGAGGGDEGEGGAQFVAADR